MHMNNGAPKLRALGRSIRLHENNTVLINSSENVSNDKFAFVMSEKPLNSCEVFVIEREETKEEYFYTPHELIRFFLVDQSLNTPFINLISDPFNHFIPESTIYYNRPNLCTFLKCKY